MNEVLEIRCVFCGRELPESEQHYRAIRGFERLRTEGGANQIHLREVKHDEHGNELYACDNCVDIRVRGHVGQVALPV